MAPSLRLWQQIHDRIAEANERLRMIELDVERIQKYVGVIARRQT